MSQRFDALWISGAHIYGDAGLGVIGSLIPATGDNGAGYTYNDLSLPADNAKEICGRITTWPSNGTLFAYEDTSFEYTALSDGTDSFQYQLYVDGAAVGSPTTVTLLTGSAPGTITASLGTATASGFAATVSSAFTLSTNLGQASALGHQATLASNQAIDCAIGAAVADGYGASISAAGMTVINCLPGIAVATGSTATVESAFSLVAGIGQASAAGYVAVITAGGSFTGSLSDADINRIAAAVWAHATRVITGPTPNDNADALLTRNWP